MITPLPEEQFKAQIRLEKQLNNLRNRAIDRVRHIPPRYQPDKPGGLALLVGGLYRLGKLGVNLLIALWFLYGGITFIDFIMQTIGRM